MNVERLRRIIAYSEKNREEINSMVKEFCSFTEIQYDTELLNIMQIVRTSFEKKGYLVLEIPFADNEIGALCYRGDGLGYVVINSSLPRVNVNFAIAHEIYHVFFQNSEFVSKVEFLDYHYYDNEEEYAANYFAGMLLMPEVSFRRMYNKFNSESKGDEFDTIIKLMAYYEVPYMAVLIRCYELKLPDGNSISNDLLGATREKIIEKCELLWLDENILCASNKDDYLRIETIVEKIGKEYTQSEYIDELTLEKVIHNMRELYIKIKGE